MKKLAFALIAVSSLALALPAAAETVVIKSGRHHHHWNSDRSAAIVIKRDRGYHRGWYRHPHPGIAVGAPGVAVIAR